MEQCRWELLLSACAEPLDDLFSVILYGGGLGKQ
jgi:hypothetical protein